MSDQPEPSKELDQQLDRLQALLMHGMYGSGNATMNVKVEGKGLTIAMCCAVFSAVMFLASLIGFGMLYLNMKDHLDAIYMIAPELHQELTHERQAVQHHHPDAAPGTGTSVGKRIDG